MNILNFNQPSKTDYSEFKVKRNCTRKYSLSGLIQTNTNVKFVSIPVNTSD